MLFIFLCIVIVIMLFSYQKASNKATDYEIKFEKNKERIKDLENSQNEKINAKSDLVLNTAQNLNKYSLLNFSIQINKPNFLQGILTLENKQYDCNFSIFQNYINLKMNSNSGKIENDFFDKDYHFYYMSGDPTTEKMVLDILNFLEIRNNISIRYSKRK